MGGAHCGGFRIQEAFAAWTQPKLDQSAGVGNNLGLPSVVTLELRQGRLGARIKRPGAIDYNDRQEVL